MEHNRTQMRGAALLLLTALIWGMAFVAQSVGMDYLGPCAFNGVRSFIGGVALLPVIAFSKHLRKNAPEEAKPAGGKVRLWLWGSACGLLLGTASLLQQAGMLTASPGKAGFLTALYIVIVPVLGIFLGRRPGLKVWAGVVLALLGAYLLSVKGSAGIAAGDLLVIGSAVVFSLHILVIDSAPDVLDGIQLSCIQFFVAGILSGIAMMIFEEPRWDQIRAAAAPILYAGIFSSGVGYTLQIVGQKGMNPTVASLILSLESSISLIAGWVLLGQSMTLRELSGCGLMFGAIILAQIPVPVRKKGE